MEDDRILQHVQRSIKILKKTKYDPGKKLRESGVLELATVILYDTGIRLGKEDYWTISKTTGLSSLKCGDIIEKGDQFILKFIGKHKIENTYVLDRPEIVKW